MSFSEDNLVMYFCQSPCFSPSLPTALKHPAHQGLTRHLKNIVSLKKMGNFKGETLQNQKHQNKNQWILLASWVIKLYTLPTTRFTRTRIIHSKNWNISKFLRNIGYRQGNCETKDSSRENIEPCYFLGKYVKTGTFLLTKVPISSRTPRTRSTEVSHSKLFFKMTILKDSSLTSFFCDVFQKNRPPEVAMNFAGFNLTRSDLHRASAGGTSINTAPAKDLLAVTLHLKGPKVSSQKKPGNSGTQKNTIYVYICIIYIYTHFYAYLFVCYKINVHIFLKKNDTKS